MFVIVAFALGSTGIANPGTELEGFAKDLLVRASPPDGKLACRLADVCAVEAGADALTHVHRFHGAGVSAAETHARAIHEMVCGVPERLVHMTSDDWVKADHLAD